MTGLIITLRGEKCGPPSVPELCNDIISTCHAYQTSMKFVKPYWFLPQCSMKFQQYISFVSLKKTTPSPSFCWGFLLTLSLPLFLSPFYTSLLSTREIMDKYSFVCGVVEKARILANVFWTSLSTCKQAASCNVRFCGTNSKSSFPSCSSIKAYITLGKWDLDFSEASNHCEAFKPM